MTQKTVTLPLVWTEDHDGEIRLTFGSLDAGCILCLGKVWRVFPNVMILSDATNSRHPTRDLAQAALEDAVMALGVSSNG